MEYTTLGRTGLEVSVAGLGAGGGSRLGMATGKSFDESVALVKAALDLGVNFFDTAEGYETESRIGAGLKGVDRDSVVISTKAWGDWRGPNLGREMVKSLDGSLKRLGTDYIDIFHLHGVWPSVYEDAKRAVPALLKEKEKGKFRHLGITEYPPRDIHHEMLDAALADDHYDVVMVAFSILNQNTRRTVFPRTMAQGVGTLIMFAVRNVFAFPDRMQAAMKELAVKGEVPAWLGDSDDPMSFLVREGGAESAVDAAYRYCRHEPGADVVLFGTGDLAHLASNVASICRPPLPAEDLQKIEELFGALEGVGLEHGVARKN